MNALLDLARALEAAAEALERSPNLYHKAWSAHLRKDRTAMLLLAAKWEPVEVQG